MRAFSFAPDQASVVVAALIADELAVRFGRHIDSMTCAAWSGFTRFDEDSLTLNVLERAACAGRVLRFFGMDALAADDLSGDAIGDWAQAAATALQRRQIRFRFTAAGDDAREFTHNADNLYGDAAAAANLLKGRRRTIALVAPHGLVGFLLTVLAPNLLRIPSFNARALDPDALAEKLSYGDAVVATPTQWRYLMREGLKAPDNTIGVFFGEPMSSELSTDMRKAGFSAQREIYGSTESGLIGWRDSTVEPFVLFDHWRRSETGIERALPDGGVWRHAPLDALQWVSDRRFLLGGRTDGAVQIGAVNVFPSRIAARIAEHPEIAGCVIDVVKDVAGANRLIATIDLKSRGPSEPVARAIDAWCRTRLAPHERPRVYHFRSSGET
jgi:4-coumarate--CoA ligase (photoactive yellow protein activation family)